MKRNEYLSQQWKKYPALSEPTYEIENLYREPTLSSHPAKISIAGRILNLQNHCVTIQQGSFSLLIHSDSELLSILQKNDIISATISTQTLKLEKQLWTCTANDIQLLAPSEPSSQSQVHLACASAHEKWSEFNQLIRDFFREHRFQEAQTPTLVPCPGMEPHLDPFQTTLQMGVQSKTLYLPTSPEFHLKKMLSAGWTKLFEIKKCFRNGEIGEHHQPEFTMLEWYRAYSNLEAICQDTVSLFSFLQDKLKHGPITKFENIEIKTVQSLFQEKLNFKLTIHTTKEELRSLAQKFHISYQQEEAWDDLYFRIFLEKIEPGLGEKNPLILTHYPPSQAALARLTEDGWADRFEVYWQGLEIANAFHELNDPQEQRRRFLADQKYKISLGKEPVPIDEEFLQALEYGLPPSGGIALGLERLFMAFHGIHNIKEIYPFSF